MGTNYYCRIIPSKEQKEELYKAIETNDFPLVNRLTVKMFGDIDKNWDTQEIEGGRVHLGKASCGWKFCWNPNVYIKTSGHLEDINGQRKYISDPDTPIYLYPLTKEGIKSFIDREDVLIYDEYDELQDKEKFWNMALNWGSNREGGGWDSASYEEYEKKEGKPYRIYPVTGALTDLLEAEGYKFTSSSNSDFYSDGLRFAGFTDFS